MKSSEGEKPFQIVKVNRRELESSECEILSPEELKKRQSETGVHDQIFRCYDSNLREALKQSIGSDIATAASVGKTIKDGSLYKVIGEPLQQNSNGNYSGVYRGENGKITGHAEFEKAGVNAARIASQVFAQGMLISIACDLQEIKHDLQDIKDELFFDHVGEVISILQTVEKEIETYQFGHEEKMADLRRELSTKTNDLRQAVSRRLEKLSPSITLWDNWNPFRPKHDQITAELNLLIPAIETLIKGITVSAELYSLIGPEQGIKSYCYDLKNLRKDIDFGKLYECSRFLPCNERSVSIQNNFRQFPHTVDKFLKIKEQRPVMFIDGKSLKQYYKQLEDQGGENGKM